MTPTKSGSATQPSRWRPSLGDVQETLLIPLYFRARETLRPDAIIRDPEAVRIVEGIDYDFTRFDTAWTVGLDCVIRTEILDERVRAFLHRHPDAVVINLGAGLDARFHRVDDGHVRWFDLDLPDAIDLRDRLLPPGDRVVHLACSMFDFSWLDRVDAAGNTPLFVIAEGLFCYCEERAVRGLFAMLAERWPGVHIAFHSISPRYVGRQARVPAVNLTRARFLWGIESGREIEAWDPSYRFLGEWAFVDRYLPRWRHLRWLSLIPWVRSELRKLMKISEVRLGGTDAHGRRAGAT